MRNVVRLRYGGELMAASAPGRLFGATQTTFTTSASWIGSAVSRTVRNTPPSRTGLDGWGGDWMMGMTGFDDVAQTVRASRDIAAPAEHIFELIADPTNQPEWDGNDNLGHAASGQRVHAVGDVFAMTLVSGVVRENHVVEFVEGRRVAWLPASEGKPTAGHLWRWELEPVDTGTTRVTHTYDWSQLTDPNRFERARNTTSDMLMASLERLAVLAERGRENTAEGKTQLKGKHS